MYERNQPVNRAGFAIIAAILILIILSALGIFAGAMLSTDIHSVTDSVRADEAFYLAEAGIPFYIANQLKHDSDWSDNTAEITKNFGGGQFSVTPLSSTSNSITLQSSGSIPVFGADIKRVIKYTMQATGPQYEPFFYALYGGGGPQLGKGELIISSIGGDIDGDIYLKDNATIVSSPGLNLNGVLSEYEASADIPAIDWSYWLATADYIYTGKKYFSKTTLNGIYLVEGDVVLDEVTVNGTVISTNDIICQGGENFVVTPEAGHPGFIAEGDIQIIAGNQAHFTINGPIYGQDNIIISSGTNLTINGSMVFGARCTITSISSIDINLSEHPIAVGFIGEKMRRITSGGFDEL
ncbi:MAG: hypothetical protein JSW17_00375 [Candidatus Omnitrophota bacterium]|nr:MAG: hypothetical protein JSW17_00375 [Candidatus Omnitrophota bacterium]